ncbi:unnamed protein product, partial [Ectocarpus sp. 13 AM-2016]
MPFGGTGFTNQDARVAAGGLTGTYSYIRICVYSTGAGPHGVISNSRVSPVDSCLPYDGEAKSPTRSGSELSPTKPPNAAVSASEPTDVSSSRGLSVLPVPPQRLPNRTGPPRAGAVPSRDDDDRSTVSSGSLPPGASGCPTAAAGWKEGCDHDLDSVVGSCGTTRDVDRKIDSSSTAMSATVFDKPEAHSERSTSARSADVFEPPNADSTLSANAVVPSDSVLLCSALCSFSFPTSSLPSGKPLFSNSPSRCGR